MTGSTPRGAPAASETGTNDLVRLREVAQAPSPERAVEAVREFLGMEVAYTSSIDEASQTIEVMGGDGESFNLAPGTEIPLEDTYCQRILGGRLPNTILGKRGPLTERERWDGGGSRFCPRSARAFLAVLDEDP